MNDVPSPLQTGPSARGELHCSRCAESRALFRPDKYVVYACIECGTIYARDDADRYAKITNPLPRKRARKELIPIGSKGKLGERGYTVIGIANKSELHKVYGSWKEYVLLDDLGGFHFLNVCYGHYTLVSEDLLIPGALILEAIQNDFEHNGRTFTYYSSYNYETLNCLGEFHYDVVDVKEVKCYDFISPPYLISIEKTGPNRMTTYSGQHLTRKQVARMFDLPLIESQEREGVGMAQPFYGGLDVRRFSRLTLLLLALIVGVSILFNVLTPTYTVCSMAKTVPAVTNDVSFVSPSFTVPDSPLSGYMQLTGSVPSLNNEWIEYDLTLVNENTGEERDLVMGMEYYSGVDDGYSWSEGADNATIGLSSVKPGKYHFNLKVVTPAYLNDKTILFEAKLASPIGWNFSFVFFPILGTLLIVLFLKRQFERMRKGEIDSLFGSAS